MTAIKIKSLIKCDGEGCSRKEDCARLSLKAQGLKLKTENCIGLGFDLFIRKRPKPNATKIKMLRRMS